MYSAPEKPIDSLDSLLNSKVLAQGTIECSPTSHTELLKLLNWARSNNRSLYPVSTGFNWGLGSKYPTDKNSIIVNLRYLNRIIEFDQNTGIVVIEPGVTQEQLAHFLEINNSKYYLDVTGSTKDSSIIGNALERGISYNSLRTENIIGLEVLTGKCETIKTGQWRLTDSKVKYHYKHGVGANLTQLFFQSNFGIVTKAIYKLQKTKPHNATVSIKFTCMKDIMACLPAFNKLFEDKVITSIFHIANSERAMNAIAPYAEKELKNETNHNLQKLLGSILSEPWFGTGCISALSKKELRIKAKQIAKGLKPYAKVQIVNLNTIQRLTKWTHILRLKTIYNLLRVTLPFRMLSFGIPTDAALGSVLELETFLSTNSPAKEVDASNKGFIYCLPITKMDRTNCDEMLSIINSTSDEFGFIPSVTLNPILPHVLEAVVSLEFDKKQEQKANQCVREMQTKLIRAGHSPYRTHKDDMDLFFTDKTYLKYLKGIKKVFDPHNLISPGRYLPISKKGNASKLTVQR